MGVEYRHFLIPDNPSFVPSKGVIKKIDDLLQKWSLKAGDPKVYNLSKDSTALVNAPLDDLDFGQGLAVKYPLVEGAFITNIMGGSFYYYDDADINDERYIQELTFVVGLDYRIHPSNEELYLEVKRPPHESNVLIKPYWDHDKILHTHAEAYHSTLSTSPPEVDIDVTNRNRIIGQQNFLGYWRTALIIDCGKDLPKLSDEEFYKIPNRDFINDVENALGCNVIEIGEVY